MQIYDNPESIFPLAVKQNAVMIGYKLRKCLKIKAGTFCYTKKCGIIRIEEAEILK